MEVVAVEERTEKSELFPVDFPAEPPPVAGQFVIPISGEVIGHHLHPIRSLGETRAEFQVQGVESINCWQYSCCLDVVLRVADLERTRDHGALEGGHPT